MAKNKASNEDVYNKIEDIVREKVFKLETENSQLKSELALARAKLEVYERIATISNPKTTLGFGPPLIKEGGE